MTARDAHALPAARNARPRPGRRDALPWRTFGACAASIGVDLAMCALLVRVAHVPADRALAVFAGGAALYVALFGLVFGLRWNRRCRDRFLTVPQLALASLIALATAAASPLVAIPMVGTLFIVLAFAALRTTPLQLLLAWAGITLGLAGVLSTSGGPPSLPADTPMQAALSTVWLSLSLGRCALLGLYGAALRRRLAQRGRDLADATGRLEHLAMRDALTGALNRRAIMESLDVALHEIRAQGGSLAVALVDLDHFKGVNDRFGHPIGDDVLRRFVGVAARSLRLSDRIGRWGGEEFLVVLPASGGPESARSVAERLREAVAAHPWHEVADGLAVTASVGVAIAGERAVSAELLARADASLYLAKRSGRNRVCVDASHGGAAFGLDSPGLFGDAAVR